MNRGNGTPVETVFDALVVGAGFAGLLMTYELRKLGLNVFTAEEGGGVGGAWYWNRYPGARADSPSSVYRLTRPELIDNGWLWTEKYAGQPEILRYLNFVADRLGVRPSVRLNTRIISAKFNEGEAHWVVETSKGDSIHCKFFISGVGRLSKRHTPDLPDLDRYHGRVLIPSDWPVNEVSLVGEDIALIGTGSTGVQLLPELAKTARQVTVFQRTPNYVVPLQNRTLQYGESKVSVEARKRIRELQEDNFYSLPIPSPGRTVNEYGVDAREAAFENAWELGGFHFLFEAFDDVMHDAEANSLACEFIRRKVKELVHDEQTAAMLCPQGYPYGAKRPPAEAGYYEAFNRQNVELVDTLTEPFVSFGPTSVESTKKSYPAGTLILATGFDAITGAIQNIEIRGVGGLLLSDKWSSKPSSFMGLGVSDFPNFFMITGPLSPFANMTSCIEHDCTWIADIIRYVRGNGFSICHPSAVAEDRWTTHAEEVAAESLVGKYAVGANSMFAGANTDDGLRRVLVYLGGATKYFRAADRVRETGYAEFVFE